LLEKNQAESFVFAVTKAKKEKDLKKDNADINNLTRKFNFKSINESLVVLAETEGNYPC
jgi:hypothetical protein